jgi:hypothetical protein
VERAHQNEPIVKPTPSKRAIEKEKMRKKKVSFVFIVGKGR